MPRHEAVLGRVFPDSIPLEVAVAGVDRARFPPELTVGQRSECPGQLSEDSERRPRLCSRPRRRERAFRSLRRPVRRPVDAVPRSPAVAPRSVDMCPKEFPRSADPSRLSWTSGQPSEGRGEPSENEFGRQRWRLRSGADSFGLVRCRVGLLLGEVVRAPSPPVVHHLQLSVP